MRVLLLFSILIPFGNLQAQVGVWELAGNTNLRNASQEFQVGTRAAWTGYSFIVWGGSVMNPANPSGSSGMNTDRGVVYDPVADTWLPKVNFLSGSGAPIPRSGHATVWSGDWLVVYGGTNYVNQQRDTIGDGGVYDPALDQWLSRPNLEGAVGAPYARMEMESVWTGTHMLVFGGWYQGPQGIFSHFDGGLYDPVTDVWEARPVLALGSGSGGFTEGLVWTGCKAVFRGGAAVSAGGIYDPATDSWGSVPSLQAGGVVHPARFRPAVWTGTCYLEFGGLTSPYTPWVTNAGLQYDPNSDVFLLKQNLNLGVSSPLPRKSHVGCWTGAHYLVWSGDSGDPMNGPRLANDGGLYEPVTDTWQSMPETNKPLGKLVTASVWTGDRLLVWAGQGSWILYGNNPQTAAERWYSDGGVYIPPRVAPTVRNLDPGDQGSASNPIVLQVGERLKHRIVCYGCPEAIIVPQNLPSWLTVGFGGPTQLVAAGTGLGNGGQNGEPPGIGAPFNPWFSAEGGTADGQWLHGTPGPGDVGTYAIQLHAHNGVAPDSATHTVYIEVLAPPGGPSFTTPVPPNAAIAGELYSAPVAAVGPPPVTSIQLSGHPWLSYANGVVSGIPPVSTGGTTQGPFTLTASNGIPPDATQLFSLTVAHAYTDINRDRAVNVTDVQLTVNIILGLTQPQWPDQGDANRDSLVNVIDVQQVVNKILNP